MACLAAIGYLVILVWGEIALISGAIVTISHGNSGTGAFYIVAAILFWVFMSALARVMAELFS